MEECKGYEHSFEESGRVISAHEPESFSILGFARDEDELKEKLRQGKIYRLHDRFFKFLFGKIEHKHLFLSLVNNIVFPNGENAFADLEFIDREYVPPFYMAVDKECRLDIACRLIDGRLVNLELQVKSEHGYIKRSVYYLTMLHATQLNSGSGYDVVRDTVSIHILGFNLFDNKFSGAGFRNSFSLRNDDTSEKLCSDLSMIYLEMPKYIKLRKERPEPMNGLERWMCYFTGLEESEMPEQMLTDPVIKEALNLEKFFMADRNERVAYVLAFKAMMDEANRESSIRRHAIEEGREEGREKGRAELINAMLRNGMKPEEISSCTGLDISEIEVLCKH